MPILSMPRTIVNGQISDASQITSMFTALETFINTTKIDDDNIQTNGITTAKLATNSVSTRTLAPESITYEKLASAVQALVEPTGALVAWHSITPPTGYLYCNGTEVSRTVYADLYAVIGDAFGEGDGSTTFHVPDLRGRFLRGVDDGEGTDPDAADRTAMNTGGNTGDAIGSVQDGATDEPTTAFTIDTVGNHTHGVPIEFENGTGGTGFSIPNLSQTSVESYTSTAAGAHTHTFSGADNETRPVNANVVWMVKY